MFCGNAAGTFFPPMVCYKAANLYEEWMEGGPENCKYAVSSNGWFDGESFQQWFFEVSK